MMAFDYISFLILAQFSLLALTGISIASRRVTIYRRPAAHSSHAALSQLQSARYRVPRHAATVTHWRFSTP